MTKEKQPGRGAYGDVVTRLEQIVQQLEAGELTLEDSLDRFAEGVQLVKQGESLLADAEKRVEQLLSQDGRTAPLTVPEVDAQRAPQSLPAQAPARTAAKKVAPVDPEEDVPF